MRAPNARVIRKGGTGPIVEIQLLPWGDYSREESSWSNSRKLSTNKESERNPPRVWTLKRLPLTREFAAASTVAK